MWWIGNWGQVGGSRGCVCTRVYVCVCASSCVEGCSEMRCGGGSGRFGLIGVVEQRASDFVHAVELDEVSRNSCESSRTRSHENL